MLITVFTPTYNRAHLLPRLYESLCKQTFKDFEWLIVDDGSTDETREVVENFNLNVNGNNDRHHENFNFNANVNNDRRPLTPSNLEGELRNEWCNPCEIPEKSFPIRYIYKANGGKHTAINVGAKEAKGELFFIADSDDMLPVNALEYVAKMYKDIREDISFCGLSGMKGYFNGKKVGTIKEFEYVDCTIIESNYKYHLHGDKAEVFKTEVLKKYPFPEFKEERFCPEALIWNRISKSYKIRYFNQIIYLCEYLPDGLTNKIAKLLEKNIRSTMLTYKEMNEFKDAPLWFRIRAAINYYRYTIFKSFKFNQEFKLKWYWGLALPLGLIVRLTKR